MITSIRYCLHIVLMVCVAFPANGLAACSLEWKPPVITTRFSMEIFQFVALAEGARFFPEPHANAVNPNVIEDAAAIRKTIQTPHVPTAFAELLFTLSDSALVDAHEALAIIDFYLVQAMADPDATMDWYLMARKTKEADFTLPWLSELMNSLQFKYMPMAFMNKPIPTELNDEDISESKAHLLRLTSGDVIRLFRSRNTGEMTALRYLPAARAESFGDPEPILIEDLAQPARGPWTKGLIPGIWKTSYWTPYDARAFKQNLQFTRHDVNHAFINISIMMLTLFATQSAEALHGKQARLSAAWEPVMRQLSAVHPLISDDHFQIWATTLGHEMTAFETTLRKEMQGASNETGGHRLFVDQEVAAMHRRIDRFIHSKGGVSWTGRPERFDINIAVREMAAHLASIGLKPVDHLSTEPLYIVMDRSLFMDITEKLMENAMEAVKRAGRLDGIQMTFETKRDEDGWPRLNLSDDGDGIPPTLGNVFNPGVSSKTDQLAVTDNLEDAASENPLKGVGLSFVQHVVSTNEASIAGISIYHDAKTGHFTETSFRPGHESQSRDVEPQPTGTLFSIFFPPAPPSAEQRDVPPTHRSSPGDRSA